MFQGIPDDTIIRVLREEDRPLEYVRVMQNILFLEVEGIRVLFDNGCGAARIYGDESGRLPESLAEAGIEPASIDALVLSHAHADHCWGTMKDDGTPAFPNAAIYMSRTELDYWQSDRAVSVRSIEGVRKHLLPLRDRIRFVEEGKEFLPGIRPLHTPGHTPGHTSYFCSFGAETWCFVADAAFHDIFSYRFPRAWTRYDIEPERGVETRLELLARIAAENIRVVGYHARWPGLGAVEKEGDSYRFLPLGEPD